MPEWLIGMLLDLATVLPYGPRPMSAFAQEIGFYAVCFVIGAGFRRWIDRPRVTR